MTGPVPATQLDAAASDPSLGEAVHVRFPTLPRSYVPRPRLKPLLDQAVDRPLTLVIAPAGSGKTATLAEWATTSRRLVTWLDPTSLADPDYLANAILSNVGTSVPAAEVSADAFVGALSQTERRPDVLVVDDAHLLPPASWSVLELALARAPHRVRLVLAGRRDLPLSTIALELDGHVGVIRADALRFDDAEAAALVAAHGADTTEDDVRTLQARARGWAAALVLGARALAGVSDRAHARSRLASSGLPILDYLLGEVFDTLPAPVRHTLLCTADEEEITAEQVLVLTQDPEAPMHLAALAGDGLLVFSYPARVGGSGWRWRYHPLLREMLRRQVTRPGPDRDVALAARHRAARSLAASGRVGDALRYVASEDTDLLVELATEHGPELLARGQDGVLRRAIVDVDGRSSTAGGLRHPAFLAVTALERLRAGDTATTVHLTMTLRALLPTGWSSDLRRPDDPAELALAADLTLLQLWERRMSGQELDEDIRIGRALVGCGPAQADPRVSREVAHRPREVLSPARHAWLLLELAEAELWTGDLARSLRHAVEVAVMARALRQDRLLSAALATQGTVELAVGMVQNGKRSARECLATARSAGWNGDVHLARAQMVVAWAALHELDLPLAEETSSAAHALLPEAPDPVTSIVGAVVEGTIRLCTTDVVEARRALAAAFPTPSGLPGYLTWSVAFVRACTALRGGDMAEVQYQAGVMRTSGWLPGSDHLLAAELSDLEGDGEGLLRHLAVAAAVDDDGRGRVIAAAARIREACWHARHGDVDSAGSALRDALSKMTTQRLLLPLVLTAPSAPHLELLLQQELQHGAPHPLAASALTAVRRHPSSGTTPNLIRGHGVAESITSGPSPPAKTDVRNQVKAVRQRDESPLEITQREQDVLHQLALGGSYADIAGALYVTRNTVKTHLAALYHKLGVTRRGDALRRARDLGLLDTPGPFAPGG